MRRTIRLTGRKQLPLNAVDLSLDMATAQTIASLIVIDNKVLGDFPANTELKLKFTENKFVETVSFGPIKNLKKKVALARENFQAPSCQIRLVSRTGENGKLLASTKSWTYKIDAETDGILLFQAGATKPLSWRLQIRDEERPILYVDERIENSALWAKSDPIFLSSVFPSVIREIFRKIIDDQIRPEDGWKVEWLRWSDQLMPGERMPITDDAMERDHWIDKLVDSFGAKHKLDEKVLKHLEKQND